jgi:hypothetical protein
VRDQRKGQKKFNWPDPRPKVRLLPLGALPKLENIATAVANNQTIEVSATGTAALFLHDAQIAVGDIRPIRRAPVCSYDYLKKREICYDVALDDNGMLDALSDMGSGNSHDPDNFHTDLAGLVFLGALLGVIEPAKIEATAIVEDIKNVTVENVATAVGNNASYTLEALSPADGEGDGNEDHMAGFNTRFGHFDFGDRDKVKVDARAVMVADITQLLIGDTKATAITKDVDIEGYNLAGINTDMGDLAGNNRPLVSNVATAVGNNLNIKVTACGTCE